MVPPLPMSITRPAEDLAASPTRRRAGLLRAELRDDQRPEQRATLNPQSPRRSSASSGPFARAISPDRCWRRCLAVARQALVLALMLFVVSACGSKQQGFGSGRPGDTPYLVRSLTIDGVKHADEDLLRSALATQPLSLNPFGSNKFLNRYEVLSDVARIETFYHLNGYFEARVLGPPDIRYFDDVLRASVKFEVEEGPLSIVSETRIIDARTASLDPVTAAASGFGYLVSRVERRLPLRRGRAFSYEAMTSSAALIRRRLQEFGYARAKVEARAYVSRADQEVIVVYRIDPGAVCVFGDVTFEGNQRLPDKILRSAANLQRGTDFRPSLLEAARNRLYGLDAFQVVDIITRLDKDDPAVIEGASSALSAPRAIARQFEAWDDPLDEELGEAYRAVNAHWAYSSEQVRLAQLSRGGSRGVATARAGWLTDAMSLQMDDEGYDAAFVVMAEADGLDTVVAQRGIDFSQLDVADPHIDVHVRVAESAAAAYRFGFGVEIDSGRWVAFARANAVWRDVFGPLNTFEADLRVGYAWLPTPFFNGLKPEEVRNRGVISRASLRYRRPQLLWNAWNFHAGVRAEKNVELIYDLLSFGGDIGIDRRWGKNYRLEIGYSVDVNREDSTLDASVDAYRLAWLSGIATFDFRDDNMQPKKGFYAELLTELGDPLIGEFLFVQVRPDLRGYIKFSRRFTLALRGTVGFLISLPSDNPVPANHRLYEGGATSFRGVPYRRLSPHRFRLQDNDPATPNNELFDHSSACREAQDAASAADPTRRYRCRPEPQGGFFSAVFSIEPRYEIGKDWLYGALFLDAGTVQNDVIPTFKLNENFWHLALGAGLRIATPLGPIRADLAYRFTNADAYADVNRLVFFLAIGEAF